MADEPILKFSGEFRWLSNFVPAKVTMYGMEFPTVEHAYQASKLINHDDRQFIAKLATPGSAKYWGKRLKLRNDWEHVKIDIMRDLVKQKFAQEPYRSMLLATGDSVIVEGNHWGDTFWGVCNEKGKNWLGVLIMTVREDLRNAGDAG